MLVSGIHQHESVIGTPVSPPSWHSLPLPTPSHPLGCYRTLVWTTISWNHLNLIPPFIYSFIPSFSELSKSYMWYVLFMHRDYWPYLDFTGFCMQSGVYVCSSMKFYHMFVYLGVLPPQSRHWNIESPLRLLLYYPSCPPSCIPLSSILYYS